MSDLYRIKVDGEWCDWDGMDTVPWHDVLQVVGGDVFRESNRIVIEPVDADRQEPTVEEIERLIGEWREQADRFREKGFNADYHSYTECADDLEELIADTTDVEEDDE